jgi:suppressor for copper-sensitivity B
MNRKIKHQNRKSIASMLIVVAALLMLPSLPTSADAGTQDFGNSFGNNDPTYFLSGEYKIAKGTRQGKLSIRMEVVEPWHTYSLEQKNNPNSIVVSPSGAYRLTGRFRSNKEPHKEFDNDLKYDVEKFKDEVTWTAPIEVGADAELEKLEFDVTVSGQVCSSVENTCIPFQEKVPVRFAGYFDDPTANVNQPPDLNNLQENGNSRSIPPTPESVEDRKSDNAVSAFNSDAFVINIGHGTLTGYLDKTELFPGDSANLMITAKLEPGYFVYQALPTVPEGIEEGVTLIVQRPDDQFKWMSQPVPSTEPTPADTGKLKKHHDTVTWKVPILVPNNVGDGILILRGQIGIQTCAEKICDPMEGVEFVQAVKIGQRAATGKLPLIFAPSSYSKVKELAAQIFEAKAREEYTADISKIEPQSLHGDGSNMSIIAVLGIALLGGFILNFMPCVLPVIGLKVMSFVQQAGQDRKKIFALNAWYALGMLLVFWILAALAAFMRMGWGEQFNNDIFNLVMISVVFVMALSFVGVWEIPIPGFISSSSAGKAERKEGPIGAISKGIIATVLATPCSGPGLATALAWCSNKDPVIIFLVFTFLGLGMAFPYIVIGLNPGLIRFLPKPGAWMETFKHMMGFILLGTVVFMLTYFDPWQVVPTIAALFGLWAACWWIGRVPFSASADQKIAAWMQASVFAVLIFCFAFMPRLGVKDYSFPGLQRTSMHKAARMVDEEIGNRNNPNQQSLFAALQDGSGSRYELESERFSVDRIFEISQRENKIVMVDFTADWCASCKVFEAAVLHTQTVTNAVEEHDVTFMVADWSSKSKDIGEILNSLRVKQIPVYAIFPPGDPYRPIVLTASDISQSNVVAALEKASKKSKADPAKSSSKRQASNRDSSTDPKRF